MPLALDIMNTLAPVGVLPKYFKSEWSVAQFRLHEGSQYVVAFGHQKNTVVILGMDGRYHVYSFLNISLSLDDSYAEQ